MTAPEGAANRFRGTCSPASRAGGGCRPTSGARSPPPIDGIRERIGPRWRMRCAGTANVSGVAALPDVPAVVCRGRLVDDQGEPYGDECGARFYPRGFAGAALADAARAAGWSVAPRNFPGHEPDALVGMCPRCLRLGGLKLTPGRLREFITAAVDAGSYVVCHSTLPAIAPEGVEPAICRGFADRYDTPALRAIRSLWGFTEVPPPEVADG